VNYWELRQDEETGQRFHQSEDNSLAKGKAFVDEQVLPHLGIGSQRIKEYPAKALHLGYMVNGLISAYMGRIPCDDRDHLENKRFEMAGPLMASLLKKYAHQLKYYRSFIAVQLCFNHNFDFLFQAC